MEKYKKKIKIYKDFPIEGVEYLDLNPLYKDNKSRNQLIDSCIKSISSISDCFDYIGLIESRGFLLGSILADRLEKGIVLLRSKPGRLPGKTKVVKHTLEYGESQMEVQVGKGNILIFDDVLATGGTAKGAIDVLKKAGYTPVSALFLAEITSFKPQLSILYKSIIKY